MDDKYEKMIEDIHSALVGNAYNEKGLIKRVDDVETKTNKHDILIKIIIGVGTVISFIAALWNDIKDII